MGLILFVILSVSHLAGWKFINQVSSHSVSLLRSSCRRTASSSPLILAYNKLSPANSLICDVTQSGISLMYVRNSSGPNTVSMSCGTPDRTGASVDVLPLQGLFGYGFGGMMLSSLGCFHRLHNILICVVVFCGVLYQKILKSRGVQSIWLPSSVCAML